MSKEHSLIQFVKPAPHNAGRLPVTAGELQSQRQSLRHKLLKAVPEAVTFALKSRDWNMYITPLSTDLLGQQIKPHITDKDDNRPWSDQIGGACDSDKRSLYVALFHATNTELTDFRNNRDVVGTYRHEMAHAFDVLLYALRTERDGAGFLSTLSLIFSDIVGQDIIAAGGVEELRSHSVLQTDYSYFTPGNVRRDRHLIEVFAEGMAIIWGGGAFGHDDGFKRRFPKTMEILNKINDAFSIMDFNDALSRKEFQKQLANVFSRAPNFRIDPMYRAVSFFYSLPKDKRLPQFQEWALNFHDGRDRFLSVGNFCVGRLAEFYERHRRAPSYRNPEKIASYIEDYGQVHQYIHCDLAGHRRDGVVRGVMHEFAHTYLPPFIKEAHICYVEAVRQIAETCEVDFLLNQYLKCEAELEKRGWANPMERLLLAKAVHTYAAGYLHVPGIDDGARQKAFLDAQVAAVRTVHRLTDNIECDFDNFKDDANYEEKFLPSFDLLYDLRHNATDTTPDRVYSRLFRVGHLQSKFNIA